VNDYARGDAHLFDTEAAHTAPESFTVYVVTVTPQVLGSGVEGNRLDYLLCRLLGGRVLGDVEVDNLAPCTSKHQGVVWSSCQERYGRRPEKVEGINQY